MINLVEQLKEHEGFRGDYYFCTANKKTIGYGRNVENNPFSKEEIKELRLDQGRGFLTDPMTEDEAEILLVNDIKKIINQIKPHLNWSELNNPRQAVCVNMAFNLGVTGFLAFKNMITALNDAYFEKAAAEMLNSRWAKQVNRRANWLAKQMYTGEWQ